MCRLSQDRKISAVGTKLVMSGLPFSLPDDLRLPRIGQDSGLQDIVIVGIGIREMEEQQLMQDHS
jgi:hypothetical protein